MQGMPDKASEIMQGGAEMNTTCSRCGQHIRKVGRLVRPLGNWFGGKACRKCRMELKGLALKRIIRT